MGDLVYCKEQDTKNETGSSKLEFEDGGSDEVDINGHFDDISVTELPAERNMSVKVMFSCFIWGSISLLLLRQPRILISIMFNAMRTVKNWFSVERNMKSFTPTLFLPI